ncbi:unnamed protein product [Polarella glacialis]|uniref:Mitochondrial carrier protein n=1 Tax=Polarella glacialis TaxID=89957 RepID=A0A813FZH4_POLGL|nr:unnamed protein product [Polarella glacialis]CAE8650259.1 unnamed protein product [Polarella glacialis]
MSTCKGSGGPLNSTNLLPVRSYAGPDTATRLLSACVGSAAVALTVTPLDVAKVRMQAAAPVHDIKSCMSLASLEHCRLFYCCNGITEHCFDKRDVRWSHCFRHQLAGASPQPAVGVGGNRLGTIGTLRNIFSEGGVAGLYAGLPVTMLIAVPANVIYFASYEMLRDWLQAEQRVPACCAPVIAGGAARAAAVTACAPLEVVRTRIQAGRLADGAAGVVSIRSAFRKIMQQDGGKGFFRGLESTLWRDVPFSAFYWLGVEAIRGTLVRRGWFEDSPLQAPLVALIASSSAGGAAAFATTPFDVVKTRRQLQTATASDSTKSLAPVSLRSSLLQVAREEGASALLRGCVPRVCRVAPACGIMLGTYELTKLLMRA